ncbi:FtsX-like permease family protein [Algoriphagus alkaliphilus]|uniref:FtsX-like permease family protein n=1 Tax=Algoriphagus alkaliphilus TaxID=279824 RepID=A0A1G5W6S7_9BACT|nr:ABC transporter permease [Algoriphagus alkaliphilus]SDA52955.1 FtsX-like permease family protein [Algoriphagus alkaliphilus]
MLKNYFTIAWRNLTRNRLRTAIHILGLSLGISISFLIFNVVWHAHSFDRFHPDRDRIFRINTTTSYSNGENYPNSGTPGPLGEVIDSEISGIEAKGRLNTLYQTLVVVPEGNRVMGRTDKVTFADPGFFQIFPRKWLAGNPLSALLQPNTVVITQSNLEKYFPGVQPLDALGKELMWIDKDTILTQVTGVVVDYTENTDFIFRDFISYSTIETEEQKQWYGLHSWGNVNSSSQLFVKVISPLDQDGLGESLNKLAEKNYSKNEVSNTSFTAEPLSEMHFGQNYTDTAVSKVFLNGLIYIGLIILALATLNFVNLETAQAIGRAKEVGIRKTLGGRRGELIFQFLTETYLLVILATGTGMVLVEVLRSVFASYLPDGFLVDYSAMQNLMFYFLFPAILSFVSGIYPSMILSGYDPQRALKGEKAAHTRFSLGIFLRKNLTVIQFSSSIAFIILVLVLNYQINFVSSQPLGFDKSAIMYASLPFMSPTEKMVQLQERINQNAVVKGSSLSGSLVSSTSLWTSDSYIPVDTTEKQVYVQVMNVDSAFVGVNGIPLLAGNSLLTNPDEILVNRNFLKEAGISEPEAALNLEIRFGGGQKKIIGVFDNFHSRTLREEIRPMIMTTNPKYFQSITVKLEPGQNLAYSKQELEAIFKNVYPFETSEFKFLDEEINQFYEEDLRIRNVLGAACILAILISAMGLFGLSSYTIAQRTKEISIRKVLGATMTQILALISKDYLVLVGISFLLAVFPAYFFLRDWLNGFQYRVDMPYFIYVLSGLGVMLLCLLIVGLHSYMAAQTNPAKVLKDE